MSEKEISREEIDKVKAMIYKFMKDNNVELRAGIYSLLEILVSNSIKHGLTEEKLINAVDFLFNLESEFSKSHLN